MPQKTDNECNRDAEKITPRSVSYGLMTVTAYIPYDAIAAQHFEFKYENVGEPYQLLLPLLSQPLRLSSI